MARKSKTAVLLSAACEAGAILGKATPEQELGAWLWMKFFTEKDNTAAWATTSNYLAVRQSAAPIAPAPVPTWTSLIADQLRRGVSVISDEIYSGLAYDYADGIAPSAAAF